MIICPCRTMGPVTAATDGDADDTRGIFSYLPRNVRGHIMCVYLPRIVIKLC